MPRTTSTGAGPPESVAGVQAACRNCRKVRRSASSAQRVKVSSNWSTMRTGREAGEVSAAGEGPVAGEDTVAGRTATGASVLGRTARGEASSDAGAPDDSSSDGCPAGDASRRAHAVTASRTPRAKRGASDPGAAGFRAASCSALRASAASAASSGIRQVSSPSGSAPGTSWSTALGRLFPSPSAPSCTAGTRPAFSSDDFPAPEAPTSMISPPVFSAARSWVTRASVLRSRPKNHRASSSRYGASPR